MSLQGKVAVITGAGQGIGADYARCLAAEGASVALADINHRGASAVADEISRQGKKAIAIAVDVSDEQSVRALADEVARQFGPADILVNNAAIYHSMKVAPILETDLAYWRKAFSVNVDGVFLCSKAFVPQMIEKGRGRIINQTSIAAYSRGVAHYNVTKLAVVGLTVNLAFELGRYNITVNAIAPGPIMTDATRSVVSDQALERLAAETPLAKNAQPSDLLGALLFLAGDGSAHMTGQTLILDGGLTVRL
jgi:NAD(P)-dependent dehydrogenase (short-subunit alcohol dehydrogenase family)